MEDGPSQRERVVSTVVEAGSTHNLARYHPPVVSVVLKVRNLNYNPKDKQTFQMEDFTSPGRRKVLPTWKLYTIKLNAESIC